MVAITRVSASGPTPGTSVRDERKRAGKPALFGCMTQRLRDDRLRRGLESLLLLLRRQPAEGREGQDSEAEAGKHQGDSDDDAEHRDLLREERGVQRVGQSGLRYPEVAGGVLDRLLGLRVDCREL